MSRDRHANKPRQPAKQSARVDAGMGTEFETVEFAKRRAKRRRQKQFAKASKRKNRKR